MKRLVFLMFSSFVFLTLSCTKEIGDLSVYEDDGMVELTFRAVTSGTKATDTSFENAISSIQVFIFSDGTLESVGFSTESDTVSLRCFRGDKDVYAVANHDEIKWKAGMTVSSLMNTIVLLDDDRWNVMVGNVSIVALEDRPVEPSDPSEPAGPLSDNDSLSDGSDTMPVYSIDNSASLDSIIITVKRVAARFVVRSVKNDSAVNGGDSLLIRCVYLTNVVGDADLSATSSTYSYSPVVWYNRCRNEGDLESILHSGDINEKLLCGDSINLEQFFYCYPNPTAEDSNRIFDPNDDGGDNGFSVEWTSRFTRLVVDTDYNGEHSYYPVTIGEVKSNHSYEVNLIITGYGAANPEGQAWGDNEGQSGGDEGGSSQDHYSPLDPDVDGEGNVFQFQGGFALVNEYN